MKRFSIFALAAVAMFVGCTKDFDTDVKVDDGIVRGELVEMSLVIEDTRVERDDVVVIEVRVAQEDMGKIIGKQGKIARAIRTVVKAASSKEEKRVVVDII